MSQHGRRTATAEKPAPPARSAAPTAPAPPAPVTAARRGKLGPISTESALVLGLIGLIAGASLLINAAQPERTRQNTTYGQTTYRTHTLGQGGIQPGEIQTRSIKPVHIAATDQLSGVPPTPAALPKPKKATAPVATAAPTSSTGTVAGGSGTGTGSGTGQTGGKNCGPLGLLCPK